MLFRPRCSIIATDGGPVRERVPGLFFREEKMSQHNTSANNRFIPKPVFLVSHSLQEAVCKEIYDYLICKKLSQLKEAILHFNKAIKQIFR